MHLPSGDAAAPALFAAVVYCSPGSLPLSSLSASVRLMFSQCDWDAGDLQAENKERKKNPPQKTTGPLSLHHLATPHHTTHDQPGQNEVEGVSVGLKIEIASAPLIYFISIGTPLHSWELMARISMNVKAGSCAVMHLCCFVLPWKQGGNRLQQIRT